MDIITPSINLKPIHHTLQSCAYLLYNKTFDDDSEESDSSSKTFSYENGKGILFDKIKENYFRLPESREFQMKIFLV